MKSREKDTEEQDKASVTNHSALSSTHRRAGNKGWRVGAIMTRDINGGNAFLANSETPQINGAS